MPDHNTLVAHMGARGYFANTCTAGTYNNEQYMALKPLGKTLRFTTDLSGAGCGCNAAFYLVSMQQNTQPSTCGDFYCDANKVCGVSCAEIDIMEANQHSWHSTLHTAYDHNGLGSGYGGGDGYDGPRDFDSSQYAPGGTCIDTARPFQVSVSFPVDAQGTLQAMEVILSQNGKSCPLTARVSGYSGMAELTKALEAGMTPTVSYWSSEAMLWMDGKGTDGRGPCVSDDPGACAATVKFYDFMLEDAGANPTASTAAPVSSDVAVVAIPPLATVPPSTTSASCPGQIQVDGLDAVAIVPTGWKSADMVQVAVPDSRTLVPHMGSRGYFASECTAGTYNNKQYLALNLLGKKMRFTVNLVGAGCGCNAALYLVSMHQNEQPSECSDYYCDANNVCGVSCAEIDIMEANQYAWHSTLHTSQDHSGKGGGYGGGFGYNGPRDWTGSEYGPSGSCIDTNKPFNVTASFPATTSGELASMDIVLSQTGHACQVKTSINTYDGMAELSQALRAGMTPVMSYWSSDDMLWMDGKGSDGQGPCGADDAAACADAVTFFGFSVEELNQDSAGSASNIHHAATAATAAAADRRCPGNIGVLGLGNVSIIPTGWTSDGKDEGAAIDVHSISGSLVPHMGARGYFANTCTAGVYSNEHYMALNLLGKTMEFDVDLAGADCGCNAAFYLVSMRQNPQPSKCGDYYCDANDVCGVSCAEIDIMEANKFSWHSTLHTSHDHSGLGGGYGGGSGYNGPRDWTGSQYAPGGSCIDTSKRFHVAVSFPTDNQGTLQAMEVTLSQVGHSCSVSTRVANYAGMVELTAALAKGMTPVFSYWSSDDMLWMDGKGTDGQGPCATDSPSKCSDTVRMEHFTLRDIGSEVAVLTPQVTHTLPPAAQPSSQLNKCLGTIHVEGHGSAALIPTGWNTPDGAAKTEVMASRFVVPHMGSRVYLADVCTPGIYNNSQYLALNLLGKTFSFTADVSKAGCGCNAALYLVSMRQNTRPSDCHDFYCDANRVCGVSCAEIDIMEANKFSWHSTLHSAHDHIGVGGGYGGGSGFNGPRDWDSSQYGPGAGCIDTNKPFRVSVSFPTDGQGILMGMDVALTQGGPCKLSTSLHQYKGMAELSAALGAGMTPVMSYWSSDDMLWMDGKGVDGRGPCSSDDAAACGAKVGFSGFSVADMGATTAVPPVSPVAPIPPSTAVGKTAVCPGNVPVQGLGEVALVPTGWMSDDGVASPVLVDRNSLVPHMGARAYFADTCTAGIYNHSQYMALNLLGKKMRFTVDLSGAGCGCNAALYLVSMRQNTQPSDCHDYYCDANSVCGVPCAEIDIMEANQFAWHSTLHTAHDHNGATSGYGGGDGFDGPRDWVGSDYAPGGRCIDTKKPFQVAVSFPRGNDGSLLAMEVELSQKDRSCPLKARVADYSGMRQLGEALFAGMTPVVSYWSSDKMLWMDGKGSDNRGPCIRDSAAACGPSVRFNDFSVEGISEREVFPAKATPAPAPVPHSGQCPGAISLAGYGQVSIVPTGWKTNDGGAAFRVSGDAVVPHMGARAYFADSCTPGAYNHSQYLALNLLGHTISFSVDLSGTGCGCNVAFYLVSMRQNTRPSECHDYYCDANNVCGESCAEIDIMEANQFSWHSTLHTAQDHNGVGGGYGGGDGYNGPRDWTSSRYAPHSKCIDTSRPVEIAASFPVDERGNLRAMEVTISQKGHDCYVSTRVSDYKGMSELSAALAAGMTPVVSYWSSDKMLWMDGQGADGKGPCKHDDAAACPAAVILSQFAVTRMHEAGLPSQHQIGSGSIDAPTTTTPKMYFAGQGEEEATETGSGYNHGALDLLKEAADLVLAAASQPSTTKRPSSSSTFDCNAGREEWDLGWSKLKKAHCCHEVDIPCPQTDSLPNPQVVPQADSLPDPQVSLGQDMCAAAYQQCGGRNWLGATCCYDGCTCKGYSKYYSQCVPKIPGGTCVAPLARTAIFMRKDSIKNVKKLPGSVDAGKTRFLHGWLSVSMYSMASLMIALAAFTVHRRLRAKDLAREGSESAGDPDLELPALPQQLFRPTIRTADGNESLESLDIDLPLCQERLFQRRPLGQESHRCVPMSQDDSPRRVDEASLCLNNRGQCSQEGLRSAEIPVRDGGGILQALTPRE